jgi:hypothetical protein
MAVVEDPEVFKLLQTKQKIGVQAGSVQGIVVGTEFAVLNLDALPASRRHLGILVAVSVDINFSILDYCPGSDRFVLPREAKAVVSDWKNDAIVLKVAVELETEDELAQVLFPERDLTKPGEVERILSARFVNVIERTKADIVVKRHAAGDDNLVIERLDNLIPKYANLTTEFNPGNKFDRFPFIFEAISQFNYHLGRHRGDDPFEHLVSLELFKLKRRMSIGEFLPDEKVGNLLVNNDARLLADRSARYGLAITNHSRHDLFPYLFYFDPSDYSISVS